MEKDERVTSARYKYIGVLQLDTLMSKEIKESMLNQNDDMLL